MLRNQGFRVELDPSSGDGGIDIKMYQRDPIGDILTAIQVKRYRPDRKIKLEAIQALHGATMAERMNASMFVTTSDYLPSSRSFAARTNVSMTLRISTDVLEWCKEAEAGIIENKASLVSREHVKGKLRYALHDPQSHILHARTGVTVYMNSFALILKETKHAALLMQLPRRIVSHDGYRQRGFEIPAIDPSDATNHRHETVFRAKKKDTGFWTGHNLYSRWHGHPCRFDICD